MYTLIILKFFSYALPSTLLFFNIKMIGLEPTMDTSVTTSESWGDELQTCYPYSAILIFANPYQQLKGGVFVGKAG